LLSLQHIDFLFDCFLDRFGSNYSTLQPRITKTLVRTWLDPSKCLSTHYGAIIGLSKLGPTVIKILILPYLKNYLSILLPNLNDVNSNRRIESNYVYHALLSATGDYIRYETQLLNTMNIDKKMKIEDSTAASTSTSSTISLNELFDLFGESLLPYTKNEISESKFNLSNTFI
jgi:transcription initiation factor TFIID subunit 6